MSVRRNGGRRDRDLHRHVAQEARHANRGFGGRLQAGEYPGFTVDIEIENPQLTTQDSGPWFQDSSSGSGSDRYHDTGTFSLGITTGYHFSYVSRPHHPPGQQPRPLGGDRGGRPLSRWAAHRAHLRTRCQATRHHDRPRRRGAKAPQPRLLRLERWRDPLSCKGGELNGSDTATVRARRTTCAPHLGRGRRTE